METAQEGESRQELSEGEPMVGLRLGADDLRTSLEAVRRAQSAARSRARRETRWARLVAVGALMAVGATAWAAVHRPRKERPVAAAPTVATAPQVAAPQAAPSIATPPKESPPAERPASTETVAPTVAVAGGAVGMSELCDAAFEQRNWTAITATCSAAFELHPQDGALAMRVAQAHHRHGRVATAAEWARKAIAIDADTPEAFVIVAHAEAGAGHPRAASDAYRRYLALAPRGWHAAEARRALRGER